MKRTIFALCLSAAMALGGTVVFPNANTSTEAGSNMGSTLSPDLTFGFEVLLAGSQFASMPAGSQVTALGFRLDGSNATSPATPIIFNDYTIILSTSNVAIGSLSNNFSTNLGPDAVTVRSGALTISPGSLPAGASPNAFYFLDFTTPYTYQGGDLLVTLRIAGKSGPSRDVDGVAISSIFDSAVEGGATHFFNSPVMAFNFAAPDAAGTPEPASGLLVAAGAGLLAFLRCRR